MEPLVSTAWLADHLTDPDLRILECTVELKPSEGDGRYVVESGEAAWARGHIPNSAYADLAGALSDPDSALNFTMPSSRRFAEGMESLGVGDGTRVVVYDRRFTMWATRLWWMLRSFGFDDASVLDGGWRAWRADRLPVSTDPAPPRPRTTFVPSPRPQLVAAKADVVRAMADGATCVINALSPEQHRGEDARYGRRGHIPGSENVYAVDMVDPDTHRYLPRDELRSRFQSALDRDRAITYCGGGIAATSDAFVLTMLGHPDVAVYDGSLSEWVQDPDAPLET
jgi:thiosulfate/3-mercaptopyruvate sulfurtransferase